MIRIATVADVRFERRAANLARSLENSPNDYRLTIYCDDETRFHDLGSPRCEIVEIAEIKRLGAKRAKLTVFALALQEGSVIYLDADAIVLENLYEFWGGSQIRGCADDLQYCSYIEDKTHPWPSDPTLVNQCYINSGALFLPIERYPFFEKLRLASLDDMTWAKYTLDGYLYDNHFLCAFINRYDEPVQLLDPQVYSWRGFLKDGQVQVYRSGTGLVNKQTGTPLKLVLFAGVQQTPDLLRSLPLEISTLIFERISRTVATLDDSLAQLYAVMSPSLTQPSADPFVNEILALSLAEIAGLVKICNGQVDLRGRASYFTNSEAMKSIVFANPQPKCT